MDVEESGRSQSVDGRVWGGTESCDVSERQPLLPGRESQFKHGHAVVLCRVCAFDVDGGSDGVGGEGYDSQSDQPVLPRERKRLMLRTSLIATVGGGGKSHQGRDREKEEPEEGGREREWPIELREGDSPAYAAREFVVKRLGLAVRPEGTAPKVALGAASAVAAVSSAGEGEHGEGDAGVAQQEAGSEAAVAGERVVQWVTQTLETEIAERQVRAAGADEENTAAQG